MRRVLRFLLRNWPLKVGALLLATVLYTGLVLSGNVRTFSGPIPVEALRQPPEVALLAELPAVTLVRYRAPLDVIVSPATFAASADLSRAVPRADGQPVSVAVRVVALDTRVQVVGYEPSVVPVHMDPVETRTMAVHVETGPVPDGLTLGTRQIDPPSVSVRGPSTRIAAIRDVIARVPIDASGLNVDREVDLQAVDEQGNVVTNIDVEPPRVRVRIPVAHQLASVTLPVAPQFVGSLPNGFRIGSITVTPPVVTVSGEEAVVGALDAAPTEDIDLSQRTRDFEVDIPLALPDGVTVTGLHDVRVAVTLSDDVASRTYAVGVALAGAQADLAYDLSASHLNVTLGGMVTALDDVNAASLAATADVSDLAPGRHVVTLEFTPPTGLELVSFSPSQVVVVVRELVTPVTE